MQKQNTKIYINWHLSTCKIRRDAWTRHMLKLKYDTHASNIILNVASNPDTKYSEACKKSDDVGNYALSMAVIPCIWNIQIWERYGIQSWPYVFLQFELTAQIPYLCNELRCSNNLNSDHLLLLYPRSKSGSLLMKKLLAMHMASRPVYVICLKKSFL